MEETKIASNIILTKTFTLYFDNKLFYKIGLLYKAIKLESDTLFLNLHLTHLEHNFLTHKIKVRSHFENDTFNDDLKLHF